MLMSVCLHLAKMGAPVKTQGVRLNASVRRAGSLKPVTKVCRRVLKDIFNQTLQMKLKIIFTGISKKRYDGNQKSSAYRYLNALVYVVFQI